jgi:spore maturation protein CgeB
MLVEDTIEHRELFGGDREAVVYFRNIDEMVHGARWLLENPHERRRLAEVSHQLMVRGGNTYRDRLHFMLEAV